MVHCYRHDPDGRRHSLDLLADSTYDAAHLFVVEAKKERALALPMPRLATCLKWLPPARCITSPARRSNAGSLSGGRN